MYEEGPPDAGTPSAALSYEKAMALAEVGQYDRAASMLAEALQAHPGEGQLLSGLAWVECKRERYEQAESLAREALREEPEWVGAHIVLATALENQGKHSECERVLLEALRMDPEDPDLYFTYGRLIWQMGQLPKAKRLVEKALELDPSHSGGHGLLALVESELKRRKEAESAGAKGLALAPDEEGNQAAMGLVYFQSGRPFAARKHLREAVRMDPGDEDIHELFLEADKACRPVYLPMYYWSLLLEKLPGQQFLVWGIMIVVIKVMSAQGVAPFWLGLVVFSYLGFCIYTWFAEPLAKLWIRIFPTK